MRILLVEDDLVIAKIISVGLRPSGFSVDHIADGDEAKEALEVFHYDGVILDLNLPMRDGLDILEEIRANRHSMPLLILSSRAKLDERVRGLDSGADDYLAKPFEVQELAARLRALLRRPKASLGRSLTCGNLRYDFVDHSVSIGELVLSLPRKEAMILENLMRNVGRTLSREILEERLYAAGEEVASNAIEVHMHHLPKRLAKIKATVKIETRRGIGYVLYNC